MNIFDEINKLFLSLSDYLNFNKILIIFVLLFLVTAFFVIIATTKSYEAKLIKSIDKFNSYFTSNPQITEDNLFHFNNMMKAGYVPKQLRKQWQQFVLYREKKASDYMSFENCVSSPLRNSGYKRAIKTLNILSYILVALSLLLNIYCMYEDVVDVAFFWQQIIITPVLVLLLNFLLTIFLETRYNAIVSDINTNFQYFETNMDKATTTIPEYVDYEVLFDKNEIKRGIPTLYAYLQKRAEEEKKALDRARLKNIEHEKFNFDEAGIESSLVLERAMQEAENYIAERKKYLQDVEQINGEITQEELNFREATKEYQRQMQVSKESFANFKEQLENVSSTIEANYLKKQQQQELDRQRNLERDYDTANENHKRVMENFQNELTSLENEIKQSRSTLEKGMMSEFSTYSSKVYDAAKKLVDERNEEQKQKLKAEIKVLEEKLAAKDQELNNIYAQNEQLNAKIINSGDNTNFAELTKEANKRGKNKHDNGDNSDNGGETIDKNLHEQVQKDEQTESEMSESNNLEEEQTATEQPKQEEPSFTFNYLDEPEEKAVENNAKSAVESGYTFNYLDEPEEKVAENNVKSAVESGYTFNYLDEPSETKKKNEKNEQTDANLDKEEFTFDYLDDILTPKDNATENKNSADNEPNMVDANANEIEANDNQKPEENKVVPRVVKSPGRPKKQKTEQKPVRGRGRPKKSETAIAEAKPKRKAGRPKKTKTTSTAKPSKTKSAKEVKPVKAKSVKTKSAAKPASTAKRGRPKKSVENADNKTSVKTEQKRRGRPKKNKDIDNEDLAKNLEAQDVRIDELEQYIKEIEAQIAEENQKIEESKKDLENNSKIKRRPRK